MVKNEKIEKPIEYWHKMGQIRHYCPKCKHSLVIPVFMDRNLCDWCGNWVYKDKQTEFRYKLQERMKKNAKSKDDKKFE